MPVFEAWKLDVDQSIEDSGLPRGDLPWTGNLNTLRRFEINTGRAMGDRASLSALQIVTLGVGLRSGNVVVAPNLAANGKPAVGRCFGGSYEPSESLVAECRAAVTAEQREELRARLVAQANAGIGQLLGSDKFAAAATVAGIGEGEGAVVRVDFAVFGAEDGNRLVSPFASGKAGGFEEAGAKASNYVGEAFGDRERKEEIEAPKAVIESAPEAVAASAPEAVVDRPVFEAERLDVDRIDDRTRPDTNEVWRWVGHQ